MLGLMRDFSSIMKSEFLVLGLFSSLAVSQSLQDAVAAYPQLSSFQQLLQTYPTLSPPPNSKDITVLVPNNTAFEDYLRITGTAVDSLPLDLLANIFQYHTLSSSYSANAFDAQKQLLVNSELTNLTYNNRNGTEGQVVLIKEVTTGSTKVKRAAPGAIDTVTSGGGSTVNLNAIDGAWSGGLFQIVDGFLTLPDLCTNTMAKNPNGLTTLQTSLVRTNLTDVLNNFANVTCLAPTNLAFQNAGSPDTNLDVPTLSNALKYHTIAGALYSVDVHDGEVQTSVAGLNVTITVKPNGTIFFNDAMVIEANVITNNGVIHVLDRIMSAPNSTEPSGSSSAAGASSTVAASSTATGAPTQTSSTTSATPSQVSTSNGNGLLGNLFSVAVAVGAAAVICSAFALL